MDSVHGNRREQAQQVEKVICATLAKAPVDQRRLADGRKTQAILIGMVREWEENRGGTVEFRPVGRKWAHFSDDALAIGDYRPYGLSADLCAISEHAMARTLGH